MTAHPFRSLCVLAVVLVHATLLVAASPPAVRGSGGAVASAAPAATDAGLEILAAGGNAVDAAVATALALAVVHPQAGNLGGGGFAVVKVGGIVATLDFREAAPAAAHHDMYLDGEGEPVRDRSLIGPLAAGVPGSPAGLWELHREHGRLDWKRVVAPAVRLADEGFVVTTRLEKSVARAAGKLSRFPETAAIWLPGGAPPAAGTTMRIPDLAATLRAYSEHGPKAISHGTVAAAVEAAAERHGGVLATADLQGYRPVWRDPVLFDAYGWHCASMPLPSSGGIILGQTAGMLQRIGWRGEPRFGADRAHLLVETWRRAYADRYLLGDPTTTEADAGELLAAAWLDRRAGGIDPQRATPSAKVGDWSSAGVESSETTHLSTADAEGNVVSMTTTLNGSFGCGLVVDGAGFLLNNEMDDFAVAPGKPNYYGLIQGEANAVGPGKRMLSSMSPTVAWRAGEVLVVGSPGGSTIPTATVQVLLNVVADGDELQAAVNRPRMHHQWMPDTVVVESDTLSPETAAELERRGHSLELRGHLGEVHAVRIRQDGIMEAAADPRGPGAAGVVAPAAETR
ncbi:MAG: gamma-glutamyltransferase [Thermoanaerobaculales bacterium]|jgi:gamma-glutamyltranspeptidase/glutathione hydrolase|nr:gamma-glutamyltransferase [Thermoanaerobaculales bacterium]